MGRTFKNLTIVASVAVLASLLVPAMAVAAEDACWSYTKAEKRFKKKINDERILDELVKLKLDPELSKAARKHTKEMIQANKKNPDKGLFHSTSKQFRNRVTNWSLIGENVGVGGGVKSLHNAFMNSPGHAANVLHLLFRYVGIGVRRYDGRMWVTVIFSAGGNPGTSLKMPSC